MEKRTALHLPPDIYLNIQLRENNRFHIGDVRQSSDHSYDKVNVVNNNKVFHVGDYSSLDVKQDHFRKMEEDMGSNPQ
jgi:hypothetical protein